MINIEEYNLKILNIKNYLNKQNENLDKNELELIINNIIGMSPKVIGTFLEKIVVM